MGHKSETLFEMSQRLCGERDLQIRQVLQMRRALEVCAGCDDDTAVRVAKNSIDVLERSGAW